MSRLRHLVRSAGSHYVRHLDFFTVPTITFRLLYCFFVIEHLCGWPQKITDGAGYCTST